MSQQQRKLHPYEIAYREKTKGRRPVPGQQPPKPKHLEAPRKAMGQHSDIQRDRIERGHHHG